jgi:hypothetical protein
MAAQCLQSAGRRRKGTILESKSVMIDLNQFDQGQSVKMRRSAARIPSNPWAPLEWGMKRSIVAGATSAQPCADCTVRPHAICAALEREELRELEQLGHRLQYRPNEPVFTQEEIAISCYNVLEGVMRLYKLLPDGRRQLVGFALPGDFLGIAVNGRHGISADAVGPVVVCRFAKK